MRGSRVGRSLLLVALTAPCLATCGCSGMSSFGGSSLQLNITDLQSREMIIQVRGRGDNVQIIEVSAAREEEVGRGTATIDRYVVVRATFGPGLGNGLFLCTKPCSRPTDSYMVAFSADQLFEPDGELRLQFRVVGQGGEIQELTHIVGPQMLPQLWQRPRIELTTER